MLIYKISQDANNLYDSFDSAVVIAENEYEAKRTHPNDFLIWHDEGWRYKDSAKECGDDTTWSDLENIGVELIGKADDKYDKSCVIASSFNAG